MANGQTIGKRLLAAATRFSRHSFVAIIHLLARAQFVVKRPFKSPAGPAVFVPEPVDSGVTQVYDAHFILPPVARRRPEHRTDERRKHVVRAGEAAHARQSVITRKPPAPGGVF
jgi:hypothetical protein